MRSELSGPFPQFGTVVDFASPTQATVFHFPFQQLLAVRFRKLVALILDFNPAEHNQGKRFYKD
jgi:hypothetical protein